MHKPFIHPDAKIGRNVIVEPFAYIAANVEIGDNCWIGPHATILDYVKLGNNCKVYPGAILGGDPQDYKFEGEETFVEVGNNTIIREYVTINRGTPNSGRGTTIVGNNCMIMSYAHIAHDCYIADNVTLTSYVGVAGVCDIGEYAIIGGHSGIHQFCKIGAYSMLSGGSMVSKDIPPYALAGHRPVVFSGVNRIGLTRRGFSRERIEAIGNIYKEIYHSGLNITDGCNSVEEKLPDSEDRRLILEFIRTSQRGVIKVR